MSQYLPYSGFKWFNQEEINRFGVNSVEENSPIGYIVEVEKLEISLNMLSNYGCSIGSKYDIKIGGVNKFVLNLGSKCECVLYYRNLQLSLLLGFKLVSVNRILKFKQPDWLNKYIDLNFGKKKCC